jgi:RNA polymerase sigma-70 factor (ECF subfamily)
MWPDTEQTEQLLRDVRQGDQAAASRLLQRHRQALRHLVQMRLDRKIQPRVDASDIVQEVLLEANRRLRDYLDNPVMPFHLWLRHIARDRIIDAHRRHRVSAKRSVDREQAMVTQGRPDRSTVDLAALLRDNQLTPAAAATATEMRRQFEAAIEQLCEQDREIVRLRHFEQLSNQQSAQALGLSMPAASMRYLRAVRRLRELLPDPNETST